MRNPLRRLGLVAVCAALGFSPALADDKAAGAAARPPGKKSIRTVDKKATAPAEMGLLDAARSGAANVEAEGLGDGRMNVTVTGYDQPPAQGRPALLPERLRSATGQMIAAWRRRWYGQEGRHGRRHGRQWAAAWGGGAAAWGGVAAWAAAWAGVVVCGGGMGGGGGTMPASMGMMTVGRLIMMLVGDMSSWNFSSLMSGGMVGGGMGGMGGGMGGMGGGMGGGMRSVPPTGAPFTVLGPNQTRSLSTRLVSLNPPSPDGTVAMPAEGEKLTLGDVGQLSADPKVASAVRRLAEAKAPSVTSQLVLWNVSAGLEWDAIAALSKGWADPRDVDLARQFVANLDAAANDDSGRLFVDVAGDSPLAAELKAQFKGATVLGLKVEAGLPDGPSGPSLAIRVVLPADVSGKAEVALKSSNGRDRWVDAGKLTLAVPLKDGKVDVPALADAVADGLVGRVLDAKLVKGKAKVKGKDVYTLQVLNRSPLILNGVAVAGLGLAKSETPGLLWGLSVGPGKVMSVSAPAETVERLGLTKGVHVLAADLSGL